jgi:sucrose-6-phosphate hydrolase SacC (GH32 family)
MPAAAAARPRARGSRSSGSGGGSGSSLGPSVRSTLGALLVLSSVTPAANTAATFSWSGDVSWSAGTLRPAARQNATPLPWPKSVYGYRRRLRTFSKDVAGWAGSARAVRSWMAARDPDFPLYHLTAPEGWVNDPNGVTFDHRTGLYHRLYQYSKTYAGPEEPHTCWGQPGNIGCDLYDYRGHEFAGCAEGEPWCLSSGPDHSGSNSTNATGNGFNTSNATGMPTWVVSSRGRTVTLSPQAYLWKAMGHAVSRDLATWEDWPGIDPDSPLDLCGIESGNCVLLDKEENRYAPGEDGVLCIYSGNTCGYKLREPNGNSAGVCAYSSDWIHWRKSACITKAPSPASQTSHDMAIFRDGSTWFVISGGCTYGGQNAPSADYPSCAGNAQVWSSPDLVNFTYVRPLKSSAGPGSYWELPYLLPFDRHGAPLRNDEFANASMTALLIGLGVGGANGAWVGAWDKNTTRFTPDGTKNSTIWPEHQAVDTGDYYSFNPHATDNRGDRNATRRLMYGWVYPVRHDSAATLLGKNDSASMIYSSAAQVKHKVPYWVGGHSLARLITLSPARQAKHELVQQVAPEVEKLRRGRPFRIRPTPLVANRTGYLRGLTGDALDITVRLHISEGASGLVGLLLRCVDVATTNVTTNVTTTNQTCVVASYSLTTGEMCAGWRPTGSSNSSVLIGRRCAAGNVLPVQDGVLALRVFLDRSFLEMYANGAALTKVCLVPDGVSPQAPKSATADLFFEPEPAETNATNATGVAGLVSFEAYAMGSMWGRV